MASVLNNVLLEEYDREIRLLQKAENEYRELPKGSIQVKIIKGYKMPYLCYRENGKYISKYIKKFEIEELKQKIDRKKYCKEVIKECKENIARLKKAIPKEILNDYERYGIS